MAHLLKHQTRKQNDIDISMLIQGSSYLTFHKRRVIPSLLSFHLKKEKIKMMFPNPVKI
jgi:hypothetical protein